MTTRRDFLATTGLVTAGVLAGTSTGLAAKDTPSTKTFKGSHELPKNLTLLSIDNGDGTETLGVKTGKGILDVRKAARLLSLSTPMTLEELLREGNAAGLNKLIAAASSSAKAKPAWLEESKIKFGRLFTHPGKIVCVGLNYKRHAKEVGMLQSVSDEWA